MASARRHAVGSRRTPADDRGALPVRRRSEPDGGTTGAVVPVARHAGGRQAVVVSRSSSGGGRQPDRRSSGGSPAPAIAHADPRIAAEATDVVRNRGPGSSARGGGA